MVHTEVAERYSIQLGTLGRLVLPAEVRRRLDLQEGDRIILSFDDEGPCASSGPGPRRRERGVCCGGSPRPYKTAVLRKS